MAVVHALSVCGNASVHVPHASSCFWRAGMVERRKKEKEMMMVMTMMSDKEESDPCPSYLLLPSYITLSLQEFYGTVPAAVLL